MSSSHVIASLPNYCHQRAICRKQPEFWTGFSIVGFVNLAVAEFSMTAVSSEIADTSILCSVKKKARFTIFSLHVVSEKSSGTHLLRIFFRAREHVRHCLCVEGVAVRRGVPLDLHLRERSTAVVSIMPGDCCRHCR